MIKTAIFILLFLLFRPLAFAQTQDDANSDKEPKDHSVADTLFRAEVERAEIRQRKLVAGTEEMNSLAQDLCKSAGHRNKLDGDDQKKLGKIEKIAKQVRSDQGGGDDDYSLE